MLSGPARLVRRLFQLWRSHGVPPHQSLTDFLRFRRLIDISIDDFFWYRLYDRSRPDDERMSWLSIPDRVRVEFRMNPREHQLILRDKAASGAYLESRGIAMPRILGVVAPVADSDSPYRRIRTIDELADLLAESPADGVVCKPAFGMQGFDVQVFSKADADGLTHLNGSSWTVGELWQLMSQPGSASRQHGGTAAWIVQERLPPHPELSRIQGPTTGCVRIVCFRYDDGTVEFLPPIWKIPVGRTGVDNLSFGTLVAPVDMETGVTGDAVSISTHMRYDRHPDTGERLSGISLPDWNGVLSLARAAALAFPQLRSLGFDIALTSRGPRLIEANPMWAPQLIQVPSGKGLVGGSFLEFLEELGAEDVIRRDARGLGDKGRARSSTSAQDDVDEATPSTPPDGGG